ncbi:MAG: insulinase family protein [Bacilli bacterium]|nr:insulinase family protein [Bacilli bacterium]
MKYQKIEKNNYNLHIIKTNKFKSINLRINFKRKIKKDEITIRNFLNDLLINSSKKYPTSRDIEIETEELYDLGISSSPYKSGNYHIISFKETFLNEIYTEKNMIKKSIIFLLELIFNPNIKENKFDKKYFELIKKTLEEDIKSLKDDTKKYSLVRLYEEMDNGPLSYRSCGYLEDLDKITDSNLYDYYKTVIENDNIDIFIIGNIEETFEEIFDEYIPNTIRIKENLSHYLNLELSEEKEIKEKMDISQSKLAIGLKISDMTDFELKYVLSLYSLILGGNPNSKLFQTIREKNSLCYYINSTALIIPKIITIVAGINKENYTKTIELIKEALENIKNGILDDKDIKEAKKIYISGCREIYDTPNLIISNYLSHEYANLDLVDTRIKEIEKVTKKDIINLAKKISIDKIFLLEGVDNIEKDTSL